jgi:hypothetical protein
VQAEKAELEDTAFKECAQLAFDKLRNIAILGSGTSEERLECCRDRAVEHAGFGSPRLVPGVVGKGPELRRRKFDRGALLPEERGTRADSQREDNR